MEGPEIELPSKEWIPADYMPGLQIIRKIREFHEYQDSCFQKLIFMDLRQNSTGFS